MERRIRFCDVLPPVNWFSMLFAVMSLCKRYFRHIHHYTVALDWNLDKLSINFLK